MEMGKKLISLHTHGETGTHMAAEIVYILFALDRWRQNPNECADSIDREGMGLEGNGWLLITILSIFTLIYANKPISKWFLMPPFPSLLHGPSAHIWSQHIAFIEPTIHTCIMKCLELFTLSIHIDLWLARQNKRRCVGVLITHLCPYLHTCSRISFIFFPMHNECERGVVSWKISAMVLWKSVL